MTIEFVAGDLLKPRVKEESLAHGCNMLGLMGAGIARDIRKMYPKDMFSDYRELCVVGDYRDTVNGEDIYTKPDGGDVQCMIYADPQYPVLFNMFTQKDIWQDRARLEWVEKSLLRVIEICREKNIKSVGMPQVGAGLGGLRWEDVKELMIRVCSPVEDVHFVCYETYVPYVGE